METHQIPIKDYYILNLNNQYIINTNETIIQNSII
jgi:hypothetical protein